jgi:hypothetical protein
MHGLLSCAVSARDRPRLLKTAEVCDQRDDVKIEHRGCQVAYTSPARAEGPRLGVR